MSSFAHEPMVPGLPKDPTKLQAKKEHYPTDIPPTQPQAILKF